jgi:hypothetical protein
MEGAAGAGNVFKQSRAGVLAGPPVAAGSTIPGAFAVAAAAGLNFTVQPGPAVVERSTLSGSYEVQSTAVGTAAVGTADPSQTRVDSVDVQVLDGALGDNAGVSKTSVKVTPGTPGLGLPTAPINSIHLGSWSVPAGCTSLAATGVWTPARKSAAVRGGIRPLMEGDALSDPGYMVAEMRDTSVLQTPGWIDRWDSVANAWRHAAAANGTGAVVIGGQVRTTLLATSGTTELVTVATNALPLEAASLYRIIFQCVGNMSSNIVERWAQRIRKTNLTGTQLTVVAISPATNASQPIGGPLSYKYFTTTAETTAFVGTIQRLTSNSAPNTWQVTGPDTFITVEYIGPSSAYTTA